MTLVHFDGFDQYATSTDLAQEYATGGNQLAVDSTSGRYGGGGLRIGGTGSSLLRKALGSSYTDLWQGMAVKDAFNNGNLSLFSFIGNSGAFEVGCDMNTSTGVFTVGRVDGASFGKISTVLGTSAAQTGLGNFNWLEFRALFGNGTAGALELWFNGVQIINVTGILTNRSGSATGYAEAYLGSRNANDTGSGNSRYGDDWYVATTRLGDCKVLTLSTTSDATPNVGTPSTAGAHYLMENETVPNTTNYVSLDASSAGNKEMYGMTSISSTASILGVRAAAYAAKSDAAEALFTACLKSGSTEVTGNTVGAIIGGNARSLVLAELDPNTGAAWTQTAVNAINVGAKTL